MALTQVKLTNGHERRLMVYFFFFSFSHTHTHTPSSSCHCPLQEYHNCYYCESALSFFFSSFIVVSIVERKGDLHSRTALSVLLLWLCLCLLRVRLPHLLHLTECHLACIPTHRHRSPGTSSTLLVRRLKTKT